MKAPGCSDAPASLTLRVPFCALLLGCAGLGLLAGCEVDDSLPTRPRTAGGLFSADDKAQQNAEQRRMEKPQRDLPTHGSDLPGQNSASAGDEHRRDADATGAAQPAGAAQPVVTLDIASAFPAVPPGHAQTHFMGWTGPSGWRAFGHTTGPETTYTQDFYPGVVPHVPPNPGTTPIPGSTPIPGGDYALDHSWGQSMVLTEAAHRDWPEVTAHYQVAEAIHNPIYFNDVQQQLPVKQNDGTRRADIKTALIDIPGFALTAAAWPVLLLLEPPDKIRTSSVPSADPNFNKYLPPGPVVASPVPGVLKWDYPFLNPDGTVMKKGSATTSKPGE